MNRREAVALGGSAAFLTGFGLGAGVAQDRDTALLTLLARFDALERCHRATVDAPSYTAEDAAEEALLSEWAAEQANLHSAICATAAQTLPGLRARAASLALWAPHLLVPDPSCWAQQANAALLRDLVALPGNMNAMSFFA